jgi:hypothetical protein
MSTEAKKIGICLSEKKVRIKLCSLLPLLGTGANEYWHLAFQKKVRIALCSLLTLLGTGANEYWHLAFKKECTCGEISQIIHIMIKCVS